MFDLQERCVAMAGTALVWHERSCQILRRLKGCAGTGVDEEGKAIRDMLYLGASANRETSNRQLAA